jgi:parallel beta-helix repeat protein
VEEYQLKRKWLAVGIILLFVGTCIIPAMAQDVEKSLPASRGNWLYVGGSGPGNYTRIQDAIDNASDGDTMFVYDDSSPYYENIRIEKSITIRGENKNSTVITGITSANNTSGVNITADAVSISRFTIQNFSHGIYLTSNNNQISDNIFRDNFGGIWTHYDNLSTSIPPHLGHNTIVNNSFINNTNSVFSVSGWNNTVEGNFISQSSIGITLGATVNTIFSLNHLSENFVGIAVLSSYNTTVYQNNFSDNELGVLTFGTSADNILQNNFIRNNWSAMSYQSFLARFRHLKITLGFPLRRAVWNGNYWDKPRSSPFIIPGVIMIAIFKVPLGFQVDWHPAQEPYDIYVGFMICLVQ